ncbi:MAG: glycoside hydrolase family 15 protein [Candidatus Dormiibacterota bacterium]
MQHPIGEHALLADSRTAALIDPDGCVAWLCWPWIDSTPLLFSILDEERGGGLTVRPSHGSARVVSRRYHHRSLVLETVWEVEGARLIVDDALALGTRPLLVRRLRAEGEDVGVDIDFRAPRWEDVAARVHTSGRALEVGGPASVVVAAPASWMPRTSGAGSSFVVRPGEPAVVTLGSSARDQHTADLETTLGSWRANVPTEDGFDIELSGSTAGEAMVRELLATSAAVLLGLRNSRGGIVAAPTTSLPQWPASSRTWDYRYCWLRDSALAGLAMLRLGLVDAARELGGFIGNVVTERGPVPLVRVDGTPPPEEVRRDDLAGYRGARPVRIGNAAAGQAQLDVPGEVIELAVALHAIDAMPDELRPAVVILADWLTDNWREPDNGIWEIRGGRHRYTHSLVTALSGLNGAATLAFSGAVAGDMDAWRRVAAGIGSELGAGDAALYLRLDGGGADAALAQVPLLAGLESIRSRAGPTLDLILERLDRDGLIDRYEGRPDTLDEPCAPFVFPTFWLSAALAAVGRDGSRWFDGALATRGPLGLFGEVADPANHTPLGNYPQVQSHASFALAVPRLRSRQ